jgi:serine/threonine protein kinase
VKSAGVSHVEGLFDVGTTNPMILADGDARSLDEDDLAPTLVAARYEIIGLLGTGGMGREFLTMELIVGESLSSRLARGLLPIPEALAVARDIVAGTHAAHTVGVVHRDLKPDNVLLEAGGRVVITDFGVARSDLFDDPTTTGERAVGTPAYMAPEQLQSLGVIDVRADIYAFGAMLFELLTGSPT